MKRALFIPALLALLALAATGRPAWALGEEDFGNAPLSDANYTDWPGIMPVVNHAARVYHWWVNGNEEFYYEGDAAAVNETLKKFAEAKSGTREAGVGGEVVLRPG